jgi:hypothetical protein|tara:strand:- start:110 stop:472 length:363 start_codon:yes stop_codon:yes gene_type:complete
MTKKFEHILKEDGHVQSANAKNQLASLKRNAEQLLAQINPDVEYPAWWLNKLVKAADYLDSAADFLQNKIDLGEEKPGLWANIRKKRARIKRGSGERMRKKGEAGAPTAAQMKRAKETSK